MTRTPTDDSTLFTDPYRGLRVVVTGGGSGISRAAAARFLELGAQVAVIDLDPSGAPEGSVRVRADIADRAQVGQAVAECAQQLGGIDVVVNNAGISAVGDVTANDDEEWARALSINVTANARASAAALPHLRASEHAAIVNMSSIAATAGLQERALYSATKGAVQAMTTDHLADGIRVNCVNPGTVATEFVDRMLQNFPDPVAERKALDARQPTGRMVTPQEVAGTVVFLASPLNTSTTGTSLAVDGGMHGLRARPRPASTSNQESRT
ncbi:NAD(P)-dependent dehydrogenase (short-subunit alcohol dehydrogenase family) [Brachybacterium muris]|uniref:SDR family NAD(P)-dependent oxidoreductase n=1 Tax=Brachybacterium muris TaxID=219301 RepID=UPI001956E302|nr:SDR family oxidoreductase [Brachybacterium muris]MBM7500242.1 NAD(P)-dependent dehydrogenase (short-subunit alcohol dehydrogenase family) [Brachybacterium muris]MCT2260518.1 SDR family oxidoreductase [Brachybacterium muris]